MTEEEKVEEQQEENLEEKQVEEVEEKQEEKPLDKMTVIELREAEKKEIPDITGVSGMKKEQLLKVLKEARGIEEKAPAKKKKKKKTSAPGSTKEMSVKEMKEEIVRLRAERESIRKEGDKKKIEIIRRRINRLKKMTRKAA
jgi:hypothetical protein